MTPLTLRARTRLLTRVVGGSPRSLECEAQIKLAPDAVRELAGQCRDRVATSGRVPRLGVAAAVRGGSGCFVNDGPGVIYQTKKSNEEPGTSYTFRIEVVDPDEMAFRFLANGISFGYFALPEADVLADKDLPYFTSGGLNYPGGGSTRAGSFNIEYVAIERR